MNKLKYILMILLVGIFTFIPLCKATLHNSVPEISALSTTNISVIQEKVRSFGFDGYLGIFDGKVPCKVGDIESAYGCYNSKINAIFVDGTQSDWNIEYTIYHELCHWKYKSNNEAETDTCAKKIINDKQLEQAFKWGFTPNK